MISAQTVFLTGDRKRAVPEGSAEARFLLVRGGMEINAEYAAKYEGAIELIGGTKKNIPTTGVVVETRDPKPVHRDPVPLKERAKRRLAKGG